jgi:hypothetical protein
MKRIADFFRRFRVYPVSHDPLLHAQSQPRKPLFHPETVKKMHEEGCFVANSRFLCVVIYPVGTEISEETPPSFFGEQAVTLPSGYMITNRFISYR